jgi:hypothetical protein
MANWNRDNRNRDDWNRRRDQIRDNKLNDWDRASDRIQNGWSDQRTTLNENRDNWNENRDKLSDNWNDRRDRFNDNLNNLGQRVDRAYDRYNNYWPGRVRPGWNAARPWNWG